MAPRAASTLILLRDGDRGLETFLLRRVTTMAFAPLMHVYPGGRVDAGDYEAAVDFTLSEAGVTALAQRASTDEAGIRALYSCAVREVAEETGIALVPPGPDGRLLIDPAAIPVADHWVTPEMEGKRYDVRFFMAVLPPGQEASLQTTEADSAFWVRPVDALAARKAGTMAMLPPTEATLRYLAGFDTAGQALVDAAQRPVVPLLPRRIVEADGSARWALVHDRTGEIVLDSVDAPHTKETDGLSFPQELR